LRDIRLFYSYTTRKKNKYPNISLLSIIARTSYATVITDYGSEARVYKTTWNCSRVAICVVENNIGEWTSL